MAKSDLYVIISYFPLCHSQTIENRAMVDSPSEEEVQHLCRIVTDSSLLSSASGCVWAGERIDELRPIFIMSQAEEIYQDICRWTQNEHSKWFTLDWAVVDDRYSILIMPRLDESIKRFRLRRLMEYEDLTIGESIILFQPLQFRSGSILQSPPSSMGLDDIKDDFDQLSGEEQQEVIKIANHKISSILHQRLPLGKQRKVGLIDPSGIDRDNLAVLTEPFWIGPLDIVPSSNYATAYLRENA